MYPRHIRHRKDDHRKIYRFEVEGAWDYSNHIIEANVEERLKPEDIESLFQASGGLPTLAILIERLIKIKFLLYIQL